MDWKLVATTFAAIFLAELGNKTQLATLGLNRGARFGSRLQAPGFRRDAFFPEA